jgi:nucleolysin TIA-1/TIAR
MAENIPFSLPPPPGTAGAPGYEGPPGANGHTQNSHMPPPPIPPTLSIPQNNNPIPTAMSGDSLSPGSARGFVTRAAPEPNKRALYVGGLDPRVTEDVLKQIFETTGHVQSVKIVPDKNVSKDLAANFAEQQVHYALL